MFYLFFKLKGGLRGVPSLNLPNFIEVSGSPSLYSYQVDLEMHHTIKGIILSIHQVLPKLREDCQHLCQMKSCYKYFLQAYTKLQSYLHHHL